MRRFVIMGAVRPHIAQPVKGFFGHFGQNDKDIFRITATAILGLFISNIWRPGNGPGPILEESQEYLPNLVA
jgi:hypothetical protein